MSLPVPAIDPTSHEGDVQSNQATLNLPVAWSCGLMWGLGLLLVIFGLLGPLGQSLAGFGSGSMPGALWLVAFLGIVATAAGPVLLGLIVSGRRRGIVSGLLGVAAGWGLLLAGWTDIAAAEALLGNWPDLFSYTFVQHAEQQLLQPLVLGAASGGVILTVLLASDKIPPDLRPRLGAGFGLGLVLVIACGLVLGSDVLAHDNVFHIYWQIPPLIWMSTVGLAEAVVGENRRETLLTWFLLVAVTLALPFVIAPLY